MMTNCRFSRLDSRESRNDGARAAESLEIASNQINHVVP